MGLLTTAFEMIFRSGSRVHEIFTGVVAAARVRRKNAKRQPSLPLAHA